MSKINAAIVEAMRDISRIGIAKLQRNTSQGYNFRGIEAAMNELSPILVKHGISVSPRYSDLTVTEQPREGKGPMRFVTLKGAFTFSADDGSNVTSEVYGESMDSGDKAVVKAQSVAFRTALFQQFVVPTMAMDPEEYEDGEGESADARAGEADMLQGFRDASLLGTAALRKHYEANTPTEAFWKKHSASLKAAAAKADKDKEPAARKAA